MGLGQKDTILHSTAFFIMICLMLLSSYIVFTSSFADIEERNTIRNTQYLIDVINDDLNSLSSSASYLALYSQFQNMDNDKEGYDRIFQDGELLKNQDIDHVLIYAPSSERLIFDSGESKEENNNYQSDEIRAYIASHPEFLSKCQNEVSFSGMIFVPERPILVAVRSFASGNISEQGTSVIVASRLLDLNDMASISEGSGLSVSLENENANKDTGDKSLIDGYVSKIFLDSSDAEYQAGSAQLYDIMGEPGYVLKVSTKEQTYSVGMSMMLHLALALMVISCLTFLAHFSIAKNVMLARLTNFINAITYVQNSGDLSARITIDGNDDITLVADNINNMLESLQNKEGKYRSLFKDSNDAILLFDSHGSIVDANSRASELLGYENSILHGLEIAYLSPDGDVSTVLDAFQQTLNKNSVNSEVQLKLFDGRVIDADVSSSVIDYKKGTVQAIIRDISENKRSAKALLDAKLAAELASRTKSEFIAVMSHELRTPLTSIIGFSDILLEGMAGDLTEKQCSYIQNISTSGNKLLELINDILDLSKIEAEEIELELEIFNVPETFEDIKNIIMPLIAKKCLSLEICIDDNLSVINADRQLFKQVLYNLLSNAIKFTPKEGNITINAELCGDMAKFAVKDNGIGIAKEEHERLFQVFTQLDSSKNRFYEGTGLGLFLVKKFVELHEGKVWLESELGKGSIFYFNIPVNVK